MHGTDVFSPGVCSQAHRAREQEIVSLACGGTGQLKAEIFIEVGEGTVVLVLGRVGDEQVLADSSQLVQPREGRWGMWKRAWNMDLPEDCEPCVERFADDAAHIVASHPDSRIGLLAYEDDTVVAVFFAQPFDGIGAATRALARDAYGSAHSRAFLLPGTEHVMLGGYQRLKNADGETLKDFVEAWASGTGW